MRSFILDFRIAFCLFLLGASLWATNVPAHGELPIFDLWMQKIKFSGREYAYENFSGAYILFKKDGSQYSIWFTFGSEVWNQKYSNLTVKNDVYTFSQRIDGDSKANVFRIKMIDANRFRILTPEKMNASSTAFFLRAPKSSGFWDIGRSPPM